MSMLNILFLSVELKYIYEMIQTNEPKWFIYDLGRRCLVIILIWQKHKDFIYIRTINAPSEINIT